MNDNCKKREWVDETGLKHYERERVKLSYSESFEGEIQCSFETNISFPVFLLNS